MPVPSQRGADIRRAIAEREAKVAALPEPPPEPSPEESPEPSPEATTPKRRTKRPSKKEQ
jgi:hypothetical protein